ncbi:type II toxin-antitoxin system death-on-curing family toxin [Lactiplantibacillus paraplantarum]|uniref:Type II toxin-antitoxin system death-on-curing family toxin n=1 Tax=Lactiplantibacillus paraplantarum TaxID=60520 RepID=A0A4Q9XYE4_9LACO|nr:type II toxin-antitoxin system death-on-curing family toxin [Lactiplantibacillus paraplantarum]TBX37977.1 type II toxin-antitoxin system death-on-curing family toxin [Lactiplantibacillus paraplantarum]WEE35828.1 type II toxin-antitoxin system death-on-curing family toxin [Lactiplantibacillus paraplantarum]
MRYLTQKDLIDINQYIIDQAGTEYGGISYPQGLDIVISQPKQAFFGREVYPNVWIKAAFIIQKITKKHIFADGNKRTALICGLTFLGLNGVTLVFDDNAGEEFILDITKAPDSEKVMVATAEWLKAHYERNDAAH